MPTPMIVVYAVARARQAADTPNYPSTARVNPTVSLLKPPAPGRHRAERAMTDMPSRASFGGARRA